MASALDVNRVRICREIQASFLKLVDDIFQDGVIHWQRVIHWGVVTGKLNSSRCYQKVRDETKTSQPGSELWEAGLENATFTLNHLNMWVPFELPLLS